VVVVVVLVVAAAVEAEEAFAVVVLPAVLTLEVAVLVRPTQPSEERPTVEAESGSARIVLRLFRTSRLSPRMCARLSRRDQAWSRAQARVRLET
jgi:hypothetical protein